MSQIKHTIIMLLISAVPFIELRGAIPYGAAFDVPIWECILLCVLGNLLPVPFIILFIRKIFNFCRKKGLLVKQIDWLENRVMKKSGVIKKYETIGLVIFVGIPLPGTGAWSGALLAALLDIRMRYALPAIVAGVIIAGIIVAGVSYGFLGFLSFLV